MGRPIRTSRLTSTHCPYQLAAATGAILEADRMAGFRVTPEIFRVERDVVLEEISLKSEDPFIPASENLLAEMFRSNSYRWTACLGNPRHLMSADVAELRQFFDRFYVPNNAVLVIAGDFEESEAAKHLVHQYFEWIQRRAHRSSAASFLNRRRRRCDGSKSIDRSIM